MRRIPPYKRISIKWGPDAWRNLALLRRRRRGAYIGAGANVNGLSQTRRPHRKRSLLQFLYEAALITKANRAPRRAVVRRTETGLAIVEPEVGDTVDVEVFIGMRKVERPQPVVDLNGADLRKADLSGAFLLGAYLNGADLSGAVLQNAVLSSVDLLIGAI